MSFEFTADDWIAGMDEPAAEPPAAEPAPALDLDTSGWVAPMEPLPEAPAPSVEIDTSTWLAPMEQPAPETPAPSVEIDTSTWLTPMNHPPAPAPSGAPDTSTWLAPEEPAAEPIDAHFEPGVVGPVADAVNPAAWIDEIGTPQATLAPAVAAGLEISDDPVVHSELLSLLAHQNELAARTVGPNPLIEADLALERLRERQGLEQV